MQERRKREGEIGKEREEGEEEERIEERRKKTQRDSLMESDTSFADSVVQSKIFLSKRISVSEA